MTQIEPLSTTDLTLLFNIMRNKKGDFALSIRKSITSELSKRGIENV